MGTREFRFGYEPAGVGPNQPHTCTQTHLRYRRMRQVASTFGIIQVGLAVVQITSDEELQVFAISLILSLACVGGGALRRRWMGHLPSF